MDHLVTLPGDGKLLLFVSHRWEELGHPDPTGRQLLALKVGLTLSLAAAFRNREDHQTSSGLPEIMSQYITSKRLAGLDDAEMCAWAETVERTATEARNEEDFWADYQEQEKGHVQEILDAIRNQVLVWYDYASMYQSPRTPDEETVFRRDLELLNEVQAGAATVVMAGDKEYLYRGWCFYEVCGGVRRRIVELTPSWGVSVRVHSSLSQWSHIQRSVDRSA